VKNDQQRRWRHLNIFVTGYESLSLIVSLYFCERIAFPAQSFQRRFSMKWKFNFGLASDDLFFVTTRSESSVCPKARLTTFADENEFLRLLIAADLPQREAERLVLGVIMSIAKPHVPPRCIEVELTDRQMDDLRLSGCLEADRAASTRHESDLTELSESLYGPVPEFYDVLMQAPVAIAMLRGPEHRFTFINKRYSSLLDTRDSSKLIDRTVAGAFPELVEQHFIEILDRVYATGKPFSGADCSWTFYRETSGRVEEGFFDATFHPILSAFGDVTGIMIQATDVTEQVLARGVRENREKLLFRQWAELESIYRASPVGLTLIDAKDFRFLRMNQRLADLLGGDASEYLGKCMLDVVLTTTDLHELFTKVVCGGTIENFVLEGELVSSPGVHRYWLASYSPTYSGDKAVEAITCALQEISEEMRAVIAGRLGDSAYSYALSS
jgi:PAS domain-containing protein